MAIKITSKTGGSEGVSDILAKYQKKLGGNIGSVGGSPVHAERIPTGLFPFDLASGGGIPRGRCTILYGPESSGKTSAVFKAIASHQQRWPELKCVYIAIEPFDAEWAGKMGVDVDALIVMSPLFAEQAVDMAYDFLSAPDIGIVAIDSLAAMITTQEAEKSAEGATVGGAGLVIGKLVRKTSLALREAEVAGRKPTLIYVNQIRSAIGVMYGNPEIMPGGNAPKFQAHLWVRFHGKPIKDSKISDTYPVRREITFQIRKSKVPIFADTGRFEMATLPHAGLQVGESNDFPIIEQYLREMGVWTKAEKAGWSIMGKTYPTIQAFKDLLSHNAALADAARKMVIEHCLSGLKGAPSPSFAVNEDGEITDDD